MGLLDALEADSVDDMIQKHQDVSGASGVGFGVGLLSNDIDNLSNNDDSIITPPVNRYPLYTNTISKR